MNLEWKADDADMQECQDAFNHIGGEDALYMTHYDLAKETGIPAEQWKRFLTQPRVVDWMTEELRLVQMIQYRKAIDNADAANRSVGAAQMINALGKSLETTGGSSDGQIFIYSYVPLNSSESLAPNTHTVDPELFEFYTEEPDAKLSKG